MRLPSEYSHVLSEAHPLQHITVRGHSGKGSGSSEGRTSLGVVYSALPDAGVMSECSVCLLKWLQMLRTDLVLLCQFRKKSLYDQRRKAMLCCCWSMLQLAALHCSSACTCILHLPPPTTTVRSNIWEPALIQLRITDQPINLRGLLQASSGKVK